MSKKLVVGNVDAVELETEFETPIEQTGYSEYVVKGGSKFRRIASVSRPVMKLDVGKTYYVQIQSPFKSELLSEEQRKKSKYPESETITIFDVLDLETGEEMQAVGRSVFVSEMSEKYPENAYVGRSFEFSLSRPEGKRYTVPRIYEIEV